MANTSERKFVLNAKYWLYESLGNFANNRNNYSTIVDAYRYIISLILRTNKRNPYLASMAFVKFDVINEIFQSKFKGNVGLAKIIYEGLSELLSESPQYFHQRAKCLLSHSGYEKSNIEQLNDALRFANIAKHNLKIEYEKTKNEKLAISLAHIIFTSALIKSRICIIHSYENLDFVNDTINSIYEAIVNPYNTNEIFENRKYKNKNKDDLKTVLVFCLKNLSQIDSKKASEIYKIYISPEI